MIKARITEIQVMTGTAATTTKKRHEYKYKIASSEAISLISRFDALLKPDKHGQDGSYYVNSLYFDNHEDIALKAKVDGLLKREKFRIRYYDNDLSFIRLECKAKYGDIGNKKTFRLSPEEVNCLLMGEYEFLLNKDTDVALNFYAKLKTQALRPRVIVRYLRKAYHYKPGNVRITFDQYLSQSDDCHEFLSGLAFFKPLNPGYVIMEVKFDAFLPSFIQDLIYQVNHNRSAYSKYGFARRYN